MGNRAPLSINQVTTKAQWSLRQAIAGYAVADVHGIAVWPDKLAECGLANAVRLLREHDMTVTGYCRGGMFASTDRTMLRRLQDDNRRMLDEAAAIGAACLVCVVGGLPDGSRDLAGARERARDGLLDLLPHARAVGVPLGIEPLHPLLAASASCINTMAQANDLCADLGAGAGIVVDTYHVWWDPDLAQQIARAAGRIVAFHISDWLVPADGIITGRGMMGDGVIDFRALRAMVDAAGYTGFTEIEIMSALDWWLRPPEEVVRTCVERYQTLC